MPLALTLGELQQCLRSVRLLLKHRQGGFLLFEGGLCVPNGHLSWLKDNVLLHEGLSERRDGRFLALELSLLALELGPLRLDRLVFLLQRRRIPSQLGRLCLDLLGLLLGCGSLRVALAAGLGQLLLPLAVSLLQVGHQGVDFAYLREEAGVVLLEPMHPGVLVGQLITFVARHLLQQL